MATSIEGALTFLLWKCHGKRGGGLGRGGVGRGEERKEEGGLLSVPLLSKEMGRL